MKISVTLDNLIVISFYVHVIGKILFYIQSFQSNDRTCITCTFLDSSTTDCVAVVHQRISQLSSSGLMNIESSHKFNRSGDNAYGCIEGINMTYYQIGVIDGKQATIQAHGGRWVSTKLY